MLRLEQQSKPHVLEVLTDLLAELKRERLDGRLWIVTERGVRIRQSVDIG